MVGDLYLSNAVIYDVPQKFSILLGEKFLIKMDTTVAEKDWSANFDQVLSMRPAENQVEFESLELGTSNVLILNDAGNEVLKRFDITVIGQEADSLGLEFSTKPRKKT